MKQVLMCCALALSLCWANAKPTETTAVVHESSSNAYVKGVKDVVEILEKITKNSLKCKADTGISDDLFAKIQNSEVVDSPEAKKYMRCFLLNMGIQKQNGEFDEEVVSETMRSGRPLTQKEKNCLKPKGTPEESAFEFYKCFDK